MRSRPIRTRLGGAVALGLLAAGGGSVGGPAAAAHAAIATDAIVGLEGSRGFGEQVTVLKNGNFVVVDPSYSTPDLADIGALFLYDGRTNQRLSTLTGSHAGDAIGTNGIEEVGNGNFVVLSPSWTSPN